jgi:hypothetical protein
MYGRTTVCTLSVVGCGLPYRALGRHWDRLAAGPVGSTSTLDWLLHLALETGPSAIPSVRHPITCLQPSALSPGGGWRGTHIVACPANLDASPSLLLTLCHHITLLRQPAADFSLLTLKSYRLRHHHPYSLVLQDQMFVPSRCYLLPAREAAMPSSPSRSFPSLYNSCHYLS